MGFYDEDSYDSEANEPTNVIELDARVQVSWDNDDVIRQVVNQVSERIYKDIKPRVTTAVLEGLDAQINQVLADMLDTEIQRTDRWGKPSGTKATVRAMLQRDAETWLTEIVDYQGRKGSDCYGPQNPRIHFIIQEALSGKPDSRGTTHLQKMVVEAARSVIGDVTVVVEKEIREQAKKALGL